MPPDSRPFPAPIGVCAYLSRKPFRPSVSGKISEIHLPPQCP